MIDNQGLKLKGAIEAFAPQKSIVAPSTSNDIQCKGASFKPKKVKIAPLMLISSPVYNPNPKQLNGMV